MELYSDLSVWAVIGVSTNALARGLRNKPLTYKPLGYAYAGLVGVGAGFLADIARQKQAAFNQKRVEALLAARESRQ